MKISPRIIGFATAAALIAAASLLSSVASAGSLDLNDPYKKDIAMQLVSSAENSSLDWKAQYKYIEDIGDGRGYTAGIIGFCSGTGDMLELVEAYTAAKPDNVLGQYLPALRQVNGTDSHNGLDPYFTSDWASAAADPVFQQAQDAERDRVYFNPAVAQAKADGLRALGQFIYYDAAVMHGPDGWNAIRNTAVNQAQTPAQGGSETDFLNAFLEARRVEMRTEPAHSDTSRIDTAQQVFLNNGNFDLNTPLNWQVYGESFSIGGGSDLLPLDQTRSLQVVTPGFTNRYLRHSNGLGFTEVVTAASDATLKADATFIIRRGLADTTCYSFESRNFAGHYLRHANFRIRKDPRDGSALFDADATFCAQPGRYGAGNVTLASYNFPGHNLRHYNADAWIAANGGPNPYDNPASYDADVTWHVTNAWTP